MRNVFVARYFLSLPAFTKVEKRNSMDCIKLTGRFCRSVEELLRMGDFLLGAKKKCQSVLDVRRGG